MGNNSMHQSMYISKYTLWYFAVILVLLLSDDDHKIDRNMLVIKNMR
jgi:hypothetical protein